MAGFQFPPPARGTGDGWVDVEYPPGDRGGGFILPPPQRADGSDSDQIAEQIAGEISWIRDTADTAAREVSNLGVVVEDYGEILDRKVEPWAVPTVAPLSQTINRRADPTFQLSDFMVPGLPLEGNTRGADGHFHALTGDHVNAGRVERGLAEGWSEGNRTYVAFITPAINRAYEEINFMVGAVSGTPANMDVAIYVVDANRQLVRQLGPIRISDEIGLGRQLVTRSFDRWVATQGSYIAVAVRQWSTGNQRPLLGLYDTPRPLSNVVFPRKITAYRHDSTSALPEVLDGETSLDFEADWFIPYIELSEAVGIDYRLFTESWGHGGVAPRPWVPITSPGIYSGTVNGVGTAYANGVGDRISIYETPLSTDHVRVSTRIVRGWTYNQTTMLIFRGTNNLRSGVALGINGSYSYQLARWDNQDPGNIWSNRTVIQSLGVTPRTGDRIEVDYLDGLVDVRINGVTLASAVSVGGPSGAAGRFMGLRFRRINTVPFISWEPSPQLGAWTARDLPQSDGGDDDGGGDGG